MDSTGSLPLKPAAGASAIERSREAGTRMTAILAIAGRALVALLFILAGAGKIATPQPFLDHMAQFGVPGFLLPAVIALELGAGLALLVGWRQRDAAAVLAAFCVLAAAIFHHDLSSKVERTSFFKDLAIAGALLSMAVASRPDKVRKR